MLISLNGLAFDSITDQIRILNKLEYFVLISSNFISTIRLNMILKLDSNIFFSIDVVFKK